MWGIFNIVKSWRGISLHVSTLSLKSSWQLCVSFKKPFSPNLFIYLETIINIEVPYNFTSYKILTRNHIVACLQFQAEERVVAWLEHSLSDHKVQVWISPWLSVRWLLHMICLGKRSRHATPSERTWKPYHGLIKPCE